MRLHLGRAPGEFHFGPHAMFPQIFFCQIDHFSCDAFAVQVLHRFCRRTLRHGQDPARRLSRGFAEQQFANLVHVRTVLLNPIVASDAAIQIAMLDVTADLLRPDQADLQLLIVHVRDVGTFAHGNIKTGLGHLFDGGLLQASFRQTQLQNIPMLLHTLPCAARAGANTPSPISSPVSPD